MTEIGITIKIKMEHGGVGTHRYLFTPGEQGLV